MAGSLQWLASQKTRPEVSPVVSLSTRGQATSVLDLKRLYETVEFLKATRERTSWTSPPPYCDLHRLVLGQHRAAQESVRCTRDDCTPAGVRSDLQGDTPRLEVGAKLKGVPQQAGSRSFGR